MSYLRWITQLLLVGYLFIEIQGQFPTVCMTNATLPMAICCPTPTGYFEACGGISRGSCEVIEVENQTSSVRWAKLPLAIRLDDRLHWPLRFFSYGCQCKGNYAGSGCEKCKFGFTGSDCNTKRPLRFRRNIFSMSKEEQRLYRDILNASKYTPTNYSVISVSGPNTSDPITKEKLYYKEATVYDFWVHFHYYAARSTMVDFEMFSCNTQLHKLNFAHIGPVIWPWHRYYLLVFEDMLADIAKNQFHQDDFALAYWDWTNQKDCVICNDDNIGDFFHPNISTSTPHTLEDLSRLRIETETTISPQSPFSHWIPMCGTNTTSIDPCFYCNLNNTRKSTFIRRLNEIPGLDVFATQEDMDYVMSLNVYDASPFDKTVANTSFRNSLEGFAVVGQHVPFIHTHNLAHSFFQGTAHDFSTSSNDPFFYFHHVFLDKVFELWLNSKTKEQTQYPNQTDELGYGHDLNDYLVPSFPPVKVHLFYRKARDFGYTYDDNFIGTSIYPPKCETGTVQQKILGVSLSLSSPDGYNVVILAVVAFVLVAGIVTLAIYKLKELCRRRYNNPNKLKQNRWLFKMPFHSRQNTEEFVPLFHS